MVNNNKWNWGALILLMCAVAVAQASEPLQVVPSSANPTAVDSLHPIARHSFLTNLERVALVDQHGRSFQPADLVGSVVLFNFIFSNCGSTCPMQTRALVQVFKALPAEIRSQIRFVSVSIDPANDTPEKLLDFAKGAGADMAGWSFLTGNVTQIEQLTQRLHIFDESETGQENKPEIHRTSLWLVDRKGRMLQRYRGNPPDTQRLIKELTQLTQI